MKHKYKGILKGILTFLMIFLTSQTKAQISSTGKEFYMSFMEMETRNGGYPDTLLIFVTAEFDISGLSGAIKQYFLSSQSTSTARWV